jgi:hypothetical protein
MEKRSGPNPSNDPANDVLAVLLDLLRNANREVQAPELNPRATTAVENFRVIANDLATTRPFAGPLPPAPPPAPPPAAVTPQPSA